MIDFNKFFTKGLGKSILLKDNGAVSHNGPWKQVYTNTLLDRFYLGDFCSAEYTISADLNNNNKEILKVLVVASLDNASVMVYSRVNTNRNIVNVSATVNSSYVDVILNPATTTESPNNDGAKIIYTVNYFQNQNPLTV